MVLDIECILGSAEIKSSSFYAVAPNALSKKTFNLLKNIGKILGAEYHD